MAPEHASTNNANANGKTKGKRFASKHRVSAFKERFDLPSFNSTRTRVYKEVAISAMKKWKGKINKVGFSACHTMMT